MDADNLKTAATYVNNLLLARGLLRNGSPIDFQSLARTSSRTGTHDGEDKENHRQGRSSKTSNAETTAQVLNLVHDLLLRRDRDQSHLESLSATLSSTRSEATQYRQEIERANARTKGLQRQADLRSTEARNATRAARDAEAGARKLQEEVQRLKNVVTQVRTQCDKDVRKKDIEYHKLKQLVSTQQRGANPGPVPKTGPITHAILDGKFGQAHRVKIPQAMHDSLDPLDADYALKTESKEFLVELSKELSDETDSLLAVLHGTLATLRELMGMEHNQPPGIKTVDLSQEQEVDELAPPPQMSCAQLEKGLNVVLCSLRDLLTSPAFAPIEEVHVREEEIERLREGWTIMEDRWREAVAMMQNWRKRMSGGLDIDMDELRMGIKLGEGGQKLAASPARHLADGLIEAENEEGQVSDEDDVDDEALFNLESLQQKDEEEEEEEGGEEEEEDSSARDDALLADLGSLDLSPAEASSDMAPVNSNVEMRRGQSQRRATRSGQAVGGAGAAGAVQGSRPRSSQPGFMRLTSAATNRRDARTAAPRSGAPAKNKANSVDNRAKSAEARAPSPALTVQQKLRLAEEEAQHASQPPFDDDESVASSASEPLQLNAAPPELDEPDRQDDGGERADTRPRGVRRAKISGLPRRRQSTLSPEELEQLMMGNSAGTETF